MLELPVFQLASNMEAGKETTRAVTSATLIHIRKCRPVHAGAQAMSALVVKQSLLVQLKQAVLKRLRLVAAVVAGDWLRVQATLVKAV